MKAQGDKYTSYTHPGVLGGTMHTTTLSHMPEHNTHMHKWLLTASFAAASCREGGGETQCWDNYGVSPCYWESYGLNSWHIKLAVTLILSTLASERPLIVHSLFFVVICTPLAQCEGIHVSHKHVHWTNTSVCYTPLLCICQQISAFLCLPRSVRGWKESTEKVQKELR